MFSWLQEIKIYQKSLKLPTPSVPPYSLRLNFKLMLTFLDVYIEIKYDAYIQHIKTSVYRKPTFSGQYLNFHSECTASHKIAGIKTSATKILKYCSTEEVFNIEVERILTDLERNGYPRCWIERVFSALTYLAALTPPTYLL